MTDYEQTFEDYWRDLVCRPDGSLDEDKVKRELHDFRGLMERTAKVYEHVTGGRVSKLNTLASEVIAIADDLATEEAEEQREAIAKGLEHEVRGGLEGPVVFPNVQRAVKRLAARIRSGEIG